MENTLDEQTNPAVTLPQDSMDRMMRFAEAIAPAKFLPAEIRGDVPSIFYMLATAEDLGLPWTHATRSMFPGKEGGMGMRGEIVLALLRRAGIDVEFAFTEDPIGCTCTITRKDSKPVSRTFTMKDAERIKTHWNGERWVSLAENPFYQNHPVDMTQWRSLARCSKVAAPDITGGLSMLEELNETANLTASPQAPPPANGPAVAFVVGEKPETLAAAEAAPLSGAAEAEPAATAPPEEKAAPAEEKAASVAAPADPPPAAEPTLDDATRFDTLIDHIATTLGGGDKKATNRLITRFMISYLDMKPLPKNKTVLLPAVEALAAAIGARAGEFRVDPEGLANELAGRTPDPLAAEFKALNWPPSVCDLARKVMAVTGQDAEGFLGWARYPNAGNPDGETGVSATDMDPESLEIFFPLFCLVKGRAWEIIEWAIANQRPIRSTLQDMLSASGVPLEKWDAPFASKILDAIKEVTPHAAPAGPAPADPPADDMFNGGLPFDQ